MQIYYGGEHSVRFTDPKAKPEDILVPVSEGGALRDSWTDLHLIPASRPVIAPPPVKTNSIEVIGANSLIDLTEVPRGFPTYGNRTGTLDFYVDDTRDDYDWAKAYNQMKMIFHGQRLRMFLTDEAANYYEGRFSINNWKTNKNISQISIDYDLDPYALAMFSTLDEWLWNPFDFLTMDIPEDYVKSMFTDMTANDSPRYFPSEIIGQMPVIPIFYVKDGDGNGMDVQVYNTFDSKWSTVVHVQESDEGTTNPIVTFSTPVPSAGTWLYASGNGKLSIDFRPGRL